MRMDEAQEAGEISAPGTYHTFVVCNIILAEVFKRGLQVDSMALNKILYLAAADYCQRTGAPLLEDQFAAWSYGPAIPSVGRHFGSGAIQQFAKNSQSVGLSLADPPEPVRRSVDMAIGLFQAFGRNELAELTRRKNGAWRKAWNRCDRFLSDQEILEDETWKSWAKDS